MSTKAQKAYNIQKGQPNLFKNPIVNALSKTSPTIAVFTYMPLVAICYYIGLNHPELAHVSIYKAISFSFFGLFSWTLVEYLMHRFFFHFINENQKIQKFHHLVHGMHHTYPRDRERLFLPSIPGLIIAFVLFCIFYAIFFIVTLGTYEAYTYFFFPGIVVGYLMYSYTHYCIHTYAPPKRLKFLWKHHGSHHYQDHERAFGVSNTFWDHIFRTLPENKFKKEADMTEDNGVV